MRIIWIHEIRRGWGLIQKNGGMVQSVLQMVRFRDIASFKELGILCKFHS